MIKRALFLAAVAAPLLMAAAAAQAQIEVYNTPSGLAGNQNIGSGTLGLDFRVIAPVTVTGLGAFDPTSGPIGGDLYTTIFNSSGTAVTPTLDFNGMSPATGSSYAFQSFSGGATYTLQPGVYQVASWGYDASMADYNDSNYNTFGSTPSPIAFNSVEGHLSPVESYYSSVSDTGQMATIEGYGAERFGAGSLVVETPTSPAPASPPESGFDAPTGLLGDQAFSGTLGLNFTVNAGSTLSVYAVGAFDSQGTKITTDIYAEIFNTDTGMAVAGSLVDLNGAGDASGAAFVFKNLASVLKLGPGNYQIAAWGFNSTFENYNSFGGTSPITFDAYNGAITATGSAFSDTAGVVATTPDVGDERYGAGAFLAEVPEPTSWAMMLVGLGSMGAVFRRRRNSAFDIA